MKTLNDLTRIELINMIVVPNKEEYHKLFNYTKNRLIRKVMMTDAEKDFVISERLKKLDNEIIEAKEKIKFCQRKKDKLLNKETENLKEIDIDWIITTLKKTGVNSKKQVVDYLEKEVVRTWTSF